MPDVLASYYFAVFCYFGLIFIAAYILYILDYYYYYYFSHTGLVIFFVASKLAFYLPIFFSVFTIKKNYFVLSIVQNVFLLHHFQEQGDHHNGGRAARRPHILCAICVRSFGAFAKAVRSLHHFTTSQCILKCALIDILVNLQSVS